MSYPFRRNLAALALLAGAIASPTYAGLMSEGQVAIDFDQPIFKAGQDVVRLYHPDSAIGGQVSAGVFSGDAREPASGFAGFNPDVLYRGIDEVLLYCIDLFQTISGGASAIYDVYSLSSDTPNVQSASDSPGAHPLERNFDRTLDFLGALNHVLNLPEFGYNINEGEYSWLNPGDPWMSGAIQVGIWESLYESAAGGEITDGNDAPLGDSDSAPALSVDASDSLRRGDFFVTGLSAPGRTLLETTFDLMNSVDFLDPTKVLILTNSNRQDMIVGDPPINVPAPAPAALVLAGLILMARRHAGLS